MLNLNKLFFSLFYFLFLFIILLINSNYSKKICKQTFKRLIHNKVIFLFFIKINTIYETIITRGFSFSNLFNTTSTFLIAQVTLQNFIKQL